MKKRLLIISDDPNLTSGLGRTVREISADFFKKYDLRVAGWHHLPVVHSFPFFIYPTEKGTGRAEANLQLILRDFSPEIILFIADIWDLIPYKNALREYKEKNSTSKIIGWITVDGDGLHSSWSELFQSMDVVATFSYFGQKEIRRISNVDAEVIYPGVDHKIFYEKDVHLKSKNKQIFDPKKTFLVLNISQNTDRKNLPVLLEAFEEFSRDKEDAFLFLGTDPVDPHGYDLWDMIKQLKINKKVAIAKDISPIGGVPDTKLSFIMNFATVLTSTAIGEGFCLPIIEAMACGIPVMATDYTAPTELLADERGVLIKVSEFIRGAFGIRRAVISKKNLVDNLNILYKDWKGNKNILKCYSDKGKSFAKDFSWEKTSKQLESLIDFSFKEKVRPWIKKDIIIKDIRLLMVIPSWGKNCGIAEYTKSLVENLRLKNLNVMVYPSNNLDSLTKFVIEHNINTVHFHHEFSFWPEKEKMRNIFRELNSHNVKTILTLHSFCKGLTSYNLMLMENVDKILVHAKSFKEELTVFEGLSAEFKPHVENVFFMPMGCDKSVSKNEKDICETRKHLGTTEYSPIIGSFGFLREQKGYRDLIFAVKTLKEKYKKILCFIYAPPHEFGSKAYDEEFFKFIEREGMNDSVIIIRDYSKKEKMLRILQSVDIFVLNYKDSPVGGGISAAVKTLMRTQRPIIVSNSIAFRDLDKEVMKIDRANQEKLSEAILQVLDRKDLQEILVKRSDLFLENNAWEKVAMEHLKIYGD